MGLISRFEDAVFQSWASVCPARCDRLENSGKCLWTYYSSLRGEFRTSTGRLAHVPCCHRHFGTSGSIQNDFKGHVKLHLGAGLRQRILARSWL
eukprot:4496571-Pleurochrysis_carterae.AAC.2